MMLLENASISMKDFYKLVLKVLILDVPSFLVIS